MATDPSDATTIAELDQARAGVDVLADLVIHFDRKLFVAGFCEARRSEILGQWLSHHLRDDSDE